MKNPVFATPEHHLYLSSQYQWKSIIINGSFQQISNLDNDPSPTVTDVDYSLLNAKIVYRVNDHLKWYVSGENLLNENYQVNRYYSMPGATFFSGLNISFR